MPGEAAEVRPRWPLRLPGPSPDGVLRRRGAGLERLLHVGGEPAVVSVCAKAGRLRFNARGADREVAREAIARMRFALSADDDLSGFYRRFRDDPLIGPSVRARPWLRLTRRPDPFEALAWAVTEQLIEYRRAVGIQRRIVALLGRHDPASGLADLPDAGTLAGTATARIERAGLSPSRSACLRRLSRLVAGGRIDLRSADRERPLAALRSLPGVGRWTTDVVAVAGQGRYDAIAAGDLGFLKWCGRLLHGRPGELAAEEQVREVFAPYGEWAALAGAHALGLNRWGEGLPRRAGTRWSARRAARSPA